jgi:lipopolysaccharide heptosyltransferase I
MRMQGRARVPLRELDARRVGLLKPSALGDIVHSLPVLTALRRRFPNATLTWIVNRSYEPLLVGHPDLDETLAFDRGAARSGVGAAVATYTDFVRQLRRRRFDLLVDLQGLLRSGLMALVSGAHRRVGLGSAREGARWFYTDVVPVADYNALHAVDRYWRVAEELGVGDGPREFKVPIGDEARAWADAVLRGLPRPWVVLGVGSRWQTKRWPPGHFVALTNRARARFGGATLFVGSAEEAPLSAAVAALLTGPTRDLTGRTTLPQLAALLARADVMVANDTGPLHLAAALGRPVVAPYTCTRNHLTGPYGAAAGVVETDVWCKGSYVKRCARLECMADLTPERLWPPLCEVLETWESRARSA